MHPIQQTPERNITIGCVYILDIDIERWETSPQGGCNAVQIVQTHHLASHLKRMTVVVRIEEQFYAFVKEQEFSDTDAFFAWTFVNKRPLWQTLLSLSWSVLTLAICLFPVYPHQAKLLILYSCAGEGIHDAFVKKVEGAVKAWATGDPFDLATRHRHQKKYTMIMEVQISLLCYCLQKKVGIIFQFPERYSVADIVLDEVILVALHLRFEPDMLAFSGCYYGGGEKEKKELGILFFDLIAQLHPEIGKHEKKPNICYTRYLSLVMEHMMKENYKNDKLLSLKPYKITVVTLITPLKNETPLTAHMCNVAEISPQPLQSLIPPYGEVNADDSADNSFSRTSMLLVTQSKATTARKPRKKTIPSLTRPEALNLSRIETSSSSQGTHLQPAEELVVFADETKSLDVSESAGAQENQNETAKAKKVLNTSVKENMEEKDKDEDHSSDVEQLLDEVDKKKLAIQHAQESPFDTKSEILFVKSFQASQIAKYAEVTLMRSGPMDMDAQTVDSEFKLKSMPDDDLQSLSGLKTSVSDSSHDVSHSEHTSWEKTASAKFQCLSGHLDHVCEESSVPDLICHSLKAQLPGLLSDALKNYLPQLLKESLTPLIPYVFESVTEEQAQLNKWEVRSTLEVAVIVDDHAEGEKSKEGQMDKNANHVTTQGEHSNVVKNDTISDASHGEHNFSPAPLKEPSPPRDPAKGKGVDMEEPGNILVPFMDEGGSNPKMPILKPFINIEVVSTQEEIIEQLAEIKRLADLRAQEEESKKALKKLLNPAAVKAQMLKWKEHEEKKAKLVNEYYQCIQRRTNPLPITKISYIINSQKEPTMRITKGNDPLNLTVYPNFRLRMLGFSEWLEVHALAS
ncbi:hypothetical protein Tco_0039522, partial [Tanacetum coccineum]